MMNVTYVRSDLSLTGAHMECIAQLPKRNKGTSIAMMLETTLAQDDPGDETSRRFRYQYTYAATACCGAIDADQDADEIYCEHHEDILIKHTDGRWTGIQVKTRASNQPVWKASDDQVKSSFARFCFLDNLFPESFRSFLFATNHPLHDAKSAASIKNIIKEAHDATIFSDLSGPIQKWISARAIEAGVSEAQALRTLKKCHARDNLPKLEDSLIRLVGDLSLMWSGAKNCTYEQLQKAATRLIDECCKASSLEHDQALSAYVRSLAPTNEVSMAIAGKRMTQEKILQALTSGLVSTAMLSGDTALTPMPGHGSSELLSRKLDAGGFSFNSINAAADLRDKADYLALGWTKKFGNERGLERYDHVRSVALSEAAKAYDETCTDKSTFGKEMAIQLRNNINSRRQAKEELFDCSDSHVEGIAYELTAECKIAWSTDRPWEDE